jgi:glycosyltransferase involved in cell wall biosynthesis
MKIAVMMRVLDQETGLSFFTDSLLRTLFELGSLFDLGDSLSYVLLYITAKHFGRYAGFKDVKEILVRSTHKLFWDQVVVPWVAWREGADVIFNPKFSVPLISHCPVAMGLQEPAWWAIPEHHTRWDVLYMRSMLPLYCRKASHLFPWSQFNLNETRKYVGLPLEHATVTPFAPDAEFNRQHDPATLADFRRSQGLPAKFILTVTRVLNLGNKAAAFTGTKNVETTLRAFSQIRERIPHELVIVGRRVREYLEHIGWKDFEGVRFAAFPREEMPKVYQSSELCVLPSFYEGCPTTLIEAMASGCATVTSKTSAFPEIGAGAALLADPHDPSDFGSKMLQVLTNPELRSELRRKSLERAKVFNGERTAQLTLEGLQSVLNRRAKESRSQKRKLVGHTSL